MTKITNTIENKMHINNVKLSTNTRDWTNCTSNPCTKYFIYL